MPGPPAATAGADADAALWAAAAAGDAEKLQALIAAGGDVCRPGEGGTTPLMVRRAGGRPGSGAAGGPAARGASLPPAAATDRAFRAAALLPSPVRTGRGRGGQRRVRRRPPEGGRPLERARRRRLLRGCARGPGSSDCTRGTRSLQRPRPRSPQSRACRRLPRPAHAARRRRRRLLPSAAAARRRLRDRVQKPQRDRAAAQLGGAVRGAAGGDGAVRGGGRGPGREGGGARAAAGRAVRGAARGDGAVRGGRGEAWARQRRRGRGRLRGRAPRGGAGGPGAAAGASPSGR
jgi:hypothetical protein